MKTLLTVALALGIVTAVQGTTVRVRPLAANGTINEVTAMEKVVKSDVEWQAQLTPEQYRITRRKGTETAFCGAFYNHKEPGLYTCVCCGLPLFESGAKFESGTGWPSFTSPVAEENVVTRPDRSMGLNRTEIVCARCDAHLGHVFEDGPPPTGRRYCLNSEALVFLARSRLDKLRVSRATVAAGCFWGVEEVFRTVKGVVATQVGYCGGARKNPTYKDVCTGETGHAEAVEISYDPAVIGYDKILEIFWKNHDPTTLNRQGPDIGHQYRSVIFYHDDTQRKIALDMKKKLEESKTYRKPVVTEIVPASPFYRAEEYHQRYLQKRGAPACPR